MHEINSTDVPLPEQPSLPWPIWAPNAAAESQTDIRCPVCYGPLAGGGDSCVHIARVDVNQNGLITTVDRHSERLEPNGPKSGRGSQVIVSFWCESGHRFAHVYQFHKGKVSMTVAAGPAADESAPQSELWRD